MLFLDGRGALKWKIFFPCGDWHLSRVWYMSWRVQERWYRQKFDTKPLKHYTKTRIRLFLRLQNVLHRFVLAGLWIGAILNEKLWWTYKTRHQSLYHAKKSVEGTQTNHNEPYDTRRLMCDRPRIHSPATPTLDESYFNNKWTDQTDRLATSIGCLITEKETNTTREYGIALGFAVKLPRPYLKSSQITVTSDQKSRKWTLKVLNPSELLTH